MATSDLCRLKSTTVKAFFIYTFLILLTDEDYGVLVCLLSIGYSLILIFQVVNCITAHRRMTYIAETPERLAFHEVCVVKGTSFVCFLVLLLLSSVVRLFTLKRYHSDPYQLILVVIGYLLFCLLYFVFVEHLTAALCFGEGSDSDKVLNLRLASLFILICAVVCFVYSLL